VRLRGNPNRDKEGVDILRHAADRDRIVALMRLGILPFFWLAALVVYGWARHSFGAAEAALATGLYTLTPPVLAHAGLATTDMALAASVSAAFFALLLWAEKPSWRRTLLLGVACGVAAITKFTSLGYLPAATLCALAAWVASTRPGFSRLRSLAAARLLPFAVAVLTGILVVWAAYLFSFGRVPFFSSIKAPMPAPELFAGIADAIGHNSAGHSAYLLGQVSKDGWWYFFPVALAVKTPIALLLLLAAGMCLCWQGRKQLGYIALAGFCLGILLPAMASHVNIGIRHVLPIYSGIAILAAAALVHPLRSSTTSGRAIAAGLLVWMTISGARAHPDYLAYFNEFAGSHPENVLVDSDLDWGQQLKWLGARLSSAGAKDYFQNMDSWALGIDLYGLPPGRALDVQNQPKGWSAVSMTVAKHLRADPVLLNTDLQSLTQAIRQPPTRWYDKVEPAETFGGLRLYKPPADR